MLILNIIKELDIYKNENKEDIFASRVKERLDKSLQEYYKETIKLLNKLYNYNEIKIIKGVKDNL